MIRMSITKASRLVAALSIALVCTACVEDSPPEEGLLDCGPGQNQTIDGVSICVITNDLLIETGFRCGPDLEEYEGDLVTVCAEGELSPEQLSGVEGFAPQGGPQPDMTPEPSPAPELGVSELQGTQCIDEGNDPEAQSLTLVEAGLEEDGYEISVTHAGVEANCCAVFRSATAAVDGEDINITYDINEDDPCDCNCFYELTFKLTKAPSGDWTVNAGGASAEISLE
jgi:hypothetical protein